MLSLAGRPHSLINPNDPHLVHDGRPHSLINSNDPHLVYDACAAVICDVAIRNHSETNTGHVAEVREERSVTQANQFAARALGEHLESPLRLVSLLALLGGLGDSAREGCQPGLGDNIDLALDRVPDLRVEGRV
jgi:hypothetical protein